MAGPTTFVSTVANTAAVTASARGTGPGSNGVHGTTSSNSDSAVYGEHASSGIGVFGRGGPAGGQGVFGQTDSTDSAVFGENRNAGASYDDLHASVGVTGVSEVGTGVRGQSRGSGTWDGDVLVSPGRPGVQGINDEDGGFGVEGRADGTFGIGVWGHSNNGTGVLGGGTSAGVSGTSPNGSGVSGEGGEGGSFKGKETGVSGYGGNFGVVADATTGVGVAASGATIGVRTSGGTNGLIATAAGGLQEDFEIPLAGKAVWGDSGDPNGVGVFGRGVTGVTGRGTNVGVVAFNPAGRGAAYLAGQSTAGWFTGTVVVNAHLYKAGGGFLIDHPADPENQLLAHSFVESSDMKNLYDGVVTLDERGAATVRLPAWCEELNREFRYQLTALGAAAPNLHISQEITDGAFHIAGGPPRGRVCWQVTGIRADAWALANPIEVEQAKPDDEKGRFLHPELKGVPDDQGIGSLRHSQAAATPAKPQN